MSKKTTKPAVAQFPLEEKNGAMYVTTKPFKRQSDAAILKQLFDVQVLRADSDRGFSYIEGVNRPVIPSHVTKMAESVARIGVTRPVVVAYFSYNGKKDYYIIDGQNLYNALLRLGMHIPYRVIDIQNETDLVEKIALLNTSSKTWTLLDYIKAWGYIREDYKKLNHYFNVYDLEISSVASVLHGYAGTSSSNITKVIKQGLFRIKNLDKSISILDFTTDVLNIVPRLDRNANRTFVSAYTAFVANNYDVYNHIKFSKVLKTHAEKFQFVNADKETITEFFKKAI